MKRAMTAHLNLQIRGVRRYVYTWTKEHPAFRRRRPGWILLYMETGSALVYSSWRRLALLELR